MFAVLACLLHLQVPLFTSIMLPLFVSFVSFEKEALLTHMMRCVA
jgi:hypothetical protein